MVYVTKLDPLNRFYVHKTPLPLPQVPLPIAPQHGLEIPEFYSIEQVLWFICLRQIERFDLCHDILDEKHRYQPDGISTFIETEGVKWPANLIYARANIYRDILLDLVSVEGLIRDTMIEQELYDGFKPYFVVCNSGKDRVWGCGMSKSDAEMVPVYSLEGYNLFGYEILRDVFDSIWKTKFPTWGLENLLKDFVDFGITNFPRFCRPKTVLVVSDSTFRDVKHIEGGKVVRQGGAMFSHIASMVEHEDLTQYGVLVISAGVNVAQRRDTWRDEIEQFGDFLSSLVHNNPNLPVVLIMGVPRPDIPDIERFNGRVKRNIDFLNLHNVKVFSWENNDLPFFENGVMCDAYFDYRDYFHLSPSGIWYIWKRIITQHNVHLKCLKYLHLGFGTVVYQEDARPGDSRLNFV